MKKYFVYEDEKSSKFWEITMTGNTIATRYGKIGSDGQIKEKQFADEDAAQKEFEKLINQKRSKGYQSPEEMTTTVNAREDFFERMRAEYCKEEPEVSIVTYAEAMEIIGEECEDLFEEAYYDEDDSYIIIVKGDIYMEGNFFVSPSLHVLPNLAHYLQQKNIDTSDLNVRGHIFLGNVVLNGLLYCDCEVYDGFLVKKNFICQRFYWKEMFTQIDGDLIVREVLFHNKGDIGFSVNNIITPVIIGDVLWSLDAGDLDVNGDIKTLCIRNQGDYEEDYSFNVKKLNKLLTKRFDSDQGDYYYTKLVLNSKPIVKPEYYIENTWNQLMRVSTVEEVREAETQKLLKQNISEKKIVLSGRQIKAFPKELLSYKNIIHLDLSNNKIKTIPNEIGNLDTLEELDLSVNLSMQDLPESIGKLKNLKKLKLTRTDSIQDLPESIAKLTNLKELDFGLCNLSEIPKAVFELTNLEKLYIHHGNISEIPDEIGRLKNLKVISFYRNPIKYLSHNIVLLQGLESLDLEGIFMSLEHDLPDLSPLLNLKTLRCNGSSGMIGSAPDHKFLKQLMAMNLCQIEKLYIDSWGEKEDRGKIYREKPKPEYLQGIGKFTNLKEIDLTNSNFTDLPEDFFKLKKLEKIELKGNDIPLETAKRLFLTYPKATINVFISHKREDLEDENYIRVRVLTKRGARFIKKGDCKSAISNFEEALSYCKQPLLYDSYDELTCYHDLICSMDEYIYKNSGKLSEDELLDLINKGFAIGEYAFKNVIPDDSLILNFTELGQLQQSCIRVISDFMVFYTYKNDLAELCNQYLPYIVRALQYLPEERFYYVYSTYVSALLYLERTEEAYKIIKKVQEDYPDFDDFKEFNNNEAYQSWLKQS